MAMFTTDDQALSCSIALDAEHESVDLTDGTGADILKFLAQSLWEKARLQQDFNGNPWPPLKLRTVIQKGHSTIGIRSGSMLAITRYVPGQTEIQPRRATWSYLHDGQGSTSYACALGFHTGSPKHRRPARPLFGWPADAIAYANSRLTVA